MIQRHPFLRHPFLLVLLASATFLGGVNLARGEQPRADAIPQTIADQFETDVLPFVTENCLDCHAADEPEAALDLSQFRSVDSVVEHFAVWDMIMRRVEAHEMPPQESGIEPTHEDRRKFVGWLQRLRSDYAERHAGDPGEVLAHRLSAAEYNYTIRDLTGFDIRPAAEFPVDPSNPAGFDNSGESLAMTPSLLNKYLDAAQRVADHLLFKPDGLEFAPHPVLTDTDRDKYCVRRIVAFYQRQPTDIAEYLIALWHWRTRNSGSALAAVAQQRGLSSKYLKTLWQLFDSKDLDLGPIRELRAKFRALPAEPPEVAAACRTLANDIQDMRAKLTFQFPHLRVTGINRGSQPLVLWRNRQQATHRMKLNVDALEELLDQAESQTIDGPEAVQRDAERSETIAAYDWFCRVFPDAFYVDRRGREYVQRKQQSELNRESEYRLLSAGFHSMMGYFRDDHPLCELILSQEEQAELDRLWFELDFIAEAPLRQHSGFIWFERAEGRYLVDAEFDEFQSADKNATSETMIERLSKVYLAKAERLRASDEALQAMRDHFRNINANIRAVEDVRPAAREAHVAMLPKLAERAYRRPLTARERLDTIAFYHQLVEVDGLSHKDAVRDVVVSILMSPHFCYRTQQSTSSEPVHRLDDYQLASRLSYFLWSSMPDEELLVLAREKRLRDPAVLRAQVRRLLQSSKSRGLAVEFGGNWLGFRQFLSHQGVDRQRFTQFDDALRQAMFEEPVRFTTDVIQNNRSVLDFLYADHTFVNRALAEHYGIRGPVAYGPDGWARCDDAHRIGRGGLLPMSVFLTKNSPGLRTSPVKRGFWVVRQLLGTHIPAPPPNVPELPADESKLGELTLREVLAKHRDHESCAGCHEKFDSVGLVFEGYGPIGERRERDLAGNVVQIEADFPDGSKRLGITGLRDYLRQQRQDEFLDTMCRKLLSYGLGRSLILSDEPLIDDMKLGLSADGYAFHTLVNSIVLSPQFLTKRGAAFSSVH